MAHRRFLPFSLVASASVVVMVFLALAGFWQSTRDASAGGSLAVQDLTGATTPQNLADSLLGGGVDVSNVTYTGGETAAGLFSGGSGPIGFESGVLLSSGHAADVIGPNNSSSSGAGLGEPGDPDLATLSGFTTNDAAILEFDFVPSTNLIIFEYVFASDEYNEFVGSNFNDVFAFYANGTNCAVVPNPGNPLASLPVSINTINNGDSNTGPTNPGLYINNDPVNADSSGSTVANPRDTEMDGLTKVLTCSAQVQPGVSNHMKLAIADASDSAYDSAVFIKGGSFVAAEGRVSGRVLGPAEDNPDNLVLLEGSMVTVCSAPPCATSPTGPTGEFVVNDLPAGDYHIIAYPPPGRNDLLPADLAISLASGESKFVGDLIMRKAVAPPAGTQIESIGSIGGVPVLDWSQPTDFSVSGCEDGLATFKVVDTSGAVLASGTMSESPPGTYNGTIIPLSPYHGPARVEVDIDCPSGPDEDIDFDVYIDPSGHVRTLQGDPIEGATVTLYRADEADGPFTQVPDGSAIMSPSNRTNPDLTDNEGFFHWDVIAGYYKVRAEKTGCHAPGNPGQAFAETEVLEIPPPALNLDIRLDCGGGGSSDQLVWGDTNCNGQVEPIDSLFILRDDAGLAINTGSCPELGTSLNLFTAALLVWGDLDCSGVVNPVDSLKTLRFDAGLSVTKVGQNCPDAGTELTTASATPQATPSPTPAPTAAPTATSAPTATPSPTPNGEIEFCWLAIVSNDIVNGFIEGEFCTPSPSGDVYTCNDTTITGVGSVQCTTPGSGPDWNCLVLTPNSSWGCSVFSPLGVSPAGFGYVCTASGVNVTCDGFDANHPDYVCDTNDGNFIECTTTHVSHPNFDCTWFANEYSCEVVLP